MTTRPTKTPAIPAPTADNLLEVAKAVKILLDIREGRLGDPRDAFLTVRDASSASGFQLSLLGGGGGGGGGGGDPGDTTPPPAPVGLTATGAFALIVLQWNSPATPNNIAYAEVWRSDTDVLGSAVMIGTSGSRFYTDSVGSSRSYFYWIRFVTRANVAGPYNATSGTAGSTSTDPQTVLDVLNSALRESHLYRGLSEPIAGIIANQDAAAEAALSATLESRARARNSARAILSLVAVNKDTYAALEREAFVRAEETGNLFGQYTVKVDLNGYVTGYGLASSVVDGVPTSAFGVVADRFFIAPVATNPSAADGAPFYVITTPTTIDGVVIQPGTYMKSAFIADATIGTAKIRSIAADKITSGYTASVDLESAVFAGSEFYIGGTVTYEFNDPARPTQRTGIASVSNPNVAFNSLGASFNVDYFRVFNGTTFETPFEISGGLVRAKRAQIQDLQVTSAKIDDMIQSNNWNGSYVAPGASTPGFFTNFGTAGWAISKAGDVAINSLYSRGAIAGGGFSPVDWTWPASGGGFFVGPQGIRLGREDSGQFFEVTAGGAIRAPGFTISGGNASFTGNITGATGTFTGSLGAATINTENIVGAAVTSGYSATTAGLTASVTVTVPDGASSIIVVVYLGDPFIAQAGSGKDIYNYTEIPAGTLTVNGSAVTNQRGTLIWSTGAPATGTYSISCSRTADSGVMNMGVLLTKR